MFTGNIIQVSVGLVVLAAVDDTAPEIDHEHTIVLFLQITIIT